jgi:hypothetical protein
MEKTTSVVYDYHIAYNSKKHAGRTAYGLRRFNLLHSAFSFYKKVGGPKPIIQFKRRN